ncbi:hypothetical protein DV736_g5318, partial [Chaetothyriales sp. CBS 134916]
MEQVAVYQLPSPTDTPYRTPSSTRSRRSQGEDELSNGTTPPPLPQDNEQYNKRRSNDSFNPALDDSISPLDPRRFTPTLHASLVSEILSLRRELETRTSDIERLETSLHQAHQQNETLNTNLHNSSKERRDMKRQMQMLEGGTYTALKDLSKERDAAVAEVTEYKRRLEQAQKKAKNQEEVAERTQVLWDKDRESWQIEKRGLQTKAQIAEGRLKVVLSEIANVQHDDQPRSPVRRAESRTSMLESPTRRRGRRHSSTSVASDNHGRVSVLSYVQGTSNNLADELAFVDEDHLMEDSAENGRLSPDALPEENVRPNSSLSLKARKVLGLPIDLDGDLKDDIDPVKPVQEPRKTVNYVDSAIQFSPPVSPIAWHKSDKHDSRSDARTDSRIDSRTESRFSKHRSRPIDLPWSWSSRQSVTGPTPASPTESMDSRYAPWNNPGPIMVSSSCQTVETLSTPPLTPDKNGGNLETIPESTAEPVEMKHGSTQTEPVEFKAPKPPKSWQHAPTESNELQIPLINIVPPTSRPATPDGASVVLPPRTKNGGTQVDRDLLGSYTSTSMQTEEIRVDRRNIIPPSQMPPLPSALFKPPLSNRAVPPRGKRVPLPSTIGQPKMKVGLSRNGQPQDGPMSREFTSIPRSSGLQQGFGQTQEKGPENDAKEVETDFFDEDDIFTRPTAKFTIKYGKMVSNESELGDIGEGFASSAGEVMAFEHLRMSEDTGPPDMKKFFRQGANRTNAVMNTQRALPHKKSLKRVPSSRSNNMRRAALISAGSSAHHASNSQSTNASNESTNPPPFPVPLRYSSAKITKSMSEGGRSSRASSNSSPTKASRLRSKHVLRKSRSGPAISPHAQVRKSGSRSRSPPLDARVSIVPEMPTFDMPIPTHIERSSISEAFVPPVEASAPRPSVATGPRRANNHMKSNSDALALHQTSVVDSIAQTMVGEWMYKYVRRRKSFGVTDKSGDWDNKSVDEISATVTNHGVRHKRWVWLAPYERAVMWSSKQPTSGSALMGGKSGRKLTIKSVLDVKDDNPLPKGAVLGGPPFNRSILILTPERALKFTATSQERHFIWLTALSFLSHSPLSANDLNAVPQTQAGSLYSQQNSSQTEQSIRPTLAGSLRRRPIRDSIRIAKHHSSASHSSRPGGGLRSFTTDASAQLHTVPIPVPIPNRFDDAEERDYYDPTTDPALPPTIKRYHERKRSNTGPKAPPSSFRVFNQRDVVPALPLLPNGSQAGGSSIVTSATGSDRGLYTPSLGPSSRRGSEASGTGRPRGPMLDPFGGGMNGATTATMRMDAFIDERRYENGPLPQIINGSLHINGPPGGGISGPGPSQPRGRADPQWGTLRSGVLRKKEDLGYWVIEDRRESISTVDSLMQNEMILAEGASLHTMTSPRMSQESRMTDPFRGF